VIRFAKPAISIFLILYLIFQLVSFQFRKTDQVGFFARFVMFIITPLQSLTENTVQGAGNIIQHYVALTNVAEENDRLVQERDELRTRIKNLREIEVENMRLRELLSLGERDVFQFVVAERLASGTSPYERTTRIKRGIQDGIMRGMAVIHARGVVGQILDVYDKSSDVLLLTDVASAIDVIDQRSRVRGILRGNTYDELRFEYVPKDEDLKIGDEVVSSGLDGVYPKGIPVGIISFVNKKGNKLFLSATVDPHIDFAKLEEVAVVIEPKGLAVR